MATTPTLDASSIRTSSSPHTCPLFLPPIYPLFALSSLNSDGSNFSSVCFYCYQEKKNLQVVFSTQKLLKMVVVVCSTSIFSTDQTAYPKCVFSSVVRINGQYFESIAKLCPFKNVSCQNQCYSFIVKANDIVCHKKDLFT